MRGAATAARGRNTSRRSHVFLGICRQIRTTGTRHRRARATRDRPLVVGTMDRRRTQRGPRRLCRAHASAVAFESHWLHAQRPRAIARCTPKSSRMPELPDVVVYIERLVAELGGATLEGVRIRSPSLLRTAEPPLASAFGRRVVGFERLGKRIVIGLDGDLFLVLHLMIAGSLEARAAWRRHARQDRPRRVRLRSRTLLLTEASSHKRASLHLVRGARRSTSSIAAASKCSSATSRRFATRCGARTTRSSARSPIRAC